MQITEKRISSKFFDKTKCLASVIELSTKPKISPRNPEYVRHQRVVVGLLFFSKVDR